MERKRSYVVYGCLVFVLCLSAFLFDVIVQNSDIMPHSFDWSGLTQLVGRHVSYNELGLVNALWRLVAYGAMGLLGLRLFFKLGFKDILNDDLKRPKIIVAIILTGVVMGVFFTWYDIMIKNEFELFTLKLGFSNLASGILTSLAEGIGDQILNMFRVSFFMWLFSKAVKSEDGRKILFLGVTVLCALIFAVEHIPTTMIFTAINFRSIFSVPIYMSMIIIGLYAPLGLVCTYFLKRHGLLSAISVHFICDLTWRVIIYTLR